MIFRKFKNFIIMNNQEKGLLYERYVKDFIILYLYKNAYLWNECPENILIENNLIQLNIDKYDEIQFNLYAEDVKKNKRITLHKPKRAEK